MAHNSSHLGACIHYAKLLFSNKEYKRSEKYFRHATVIDPENVPARFGLAKSIHASTSDRNYAIIHYE